MADDFSFSFNGGGITASGTFNASQTSTAGVDEITGISGTFSDTNAHVSGAITGLYTPVSYVSNTLASPGIAFTTGGLSYDDTFYPAGNSPAICYDLVNGVPTLTYPFSEASSTSLAWRLILPEVTLVNFGVTATWAAGLSFTQLGWRMFQGCWTTQIPVPTLFPPGEYGAFTTTHVPEPSTLLLLGMGLLGLATLCARKRNHMDSFHIRTQSMEQSNC